MEFKRLCLLLLTIAPLSHAAYDAEDTFKLNAELAYRYDDNVFRLAEGANNSITKSNGSHSDSNVLASVGGRLDLPVSRQNLYLQGNVSRQTYFKFDELTNTAWTVGLGWDWQAGNQFFGNLNADASSAMSSFDDVRNGAVDMVRQTNVNWSGYWAVTSNWLLLADAAYGKEDHDERQFENAKTLSYGLGLRYVTDKGSSITLRHQWLKYDYLADLLGVSAELRGYKEQNSSIALSWPMTSQVKVQAKAGISRWESNFSGQSSSSTPQGDLSLTWQLTGKSNLRAGVAQNFDQFNSGVGRDLERSYYAGLNWIMTEKVRWDAEYRYRQKETKTVNDLRVRDELYDSVDFSVVYQVFRNTSLKPYLRYETRDDQIGKADYKDTQIGLSGRYDF